MNEELDHFDLLSKEPIYLNKTGSVISPQLKDISKVGNTIYNLYINLINLNPKQYYEFIKQSELYESISSEEKANMNMYDLIINDNQIRDMIERALDFFMLEKVIYNDEYKIFVTYNGEDDKNGEPIPCGIINNDTYQKVCNVILQRNYVKSENQEVEPPKYKNEMARKLAERMEKASKKKAEKEKNNLTFGKMVSKYCADNKNGINMLNVFDLTMYQFLDQWSEHNNIRQADIQDMVYANTVSFSDLSAYDSQVWLK